MILIRFVLFRLIFARSKLLAIWQIKEKIVSTVRLVYYTLVDNYMYKHVQDRRYRKYGIRRAIIATSAFGRTRRSRLAYKLTTGHVGGTVGPRLGSSGWCIKYVGYAMMGGVKNRVSRMVRQRQQGCQPKSVSRSETCSFYEWDCGYYEWDVLWILKLTPIFNFMTLPINHSPDS